jgi:hypothetical protein
VVYSGRTKGGQAFSGQQLACGMHQPIAGHGFSPEAHWHASPGFAQVEPASALQSALVQHSSAEMHA